MFTRLLTRKIQIWTRVCIDPYILTKNGDKSRIIVLGGFYE